MKNFLSLSFLIVLILNLVNSRCPFVRIETDFSVQKFSGVWYEATRSKNAPFQTYECNKHKLTIRNDGKIDFLNSEYNINRDRLYKSDGVLTLSIAKGFYKYSLLGPRRDYRVLSTDYTNYAIVYSCVNSAIFFKTEYAWIYTRKRETDPKVIDGYIAILNQQLSYYNHDSFKFTDQGTRCTYAADI